MCCVDRGSGSYGNNDYGGPSLSHLNMALLVMVVIVALVGFRCRWW